MAFFDPYTRTDLTVSIELRLNFGLRRFEMHEEVDAEVDRVRRRFEEGLRKTGKAKTADVLAALFQVGACSGVAEIGDVEMGDAMGAKWRELIEKECAKP